MPPAGVGTVPSLMWAAYNRPTPTSAACCNSMIVLPSSISPLRIICSARASGSSSTSMSSPSRASPPPTTTRWVVRRKAEVVAAVSGGLLSVDDVCTRYGLTVEEFAGWQRAIDRSGMPGLRVTRIQHYKSLYERQQKF